MRPSQRLDLIIRLASELQSRYTVNDIDVYLNAHGIETPLPYDGFPDAAAYAKRYISRLTDEALLTIADDLEVGLPASTRLSLVPPKNWVETDQFRLFISHVSAEKDKAARLKDCLAPYAINGFVAHEDIHPTLEWQKQIERALWTMDAFLAMHTKGFSQSFWTQQEIGFAVCRGVKIISLKMGEDPTGFISVRQALSRLGRAAEGIAAEVESLLKDDELTAARLHSAQQAQKLRKIDEEIPF